MSCELRLSYLFLEIKNEEINQWIYYLTPGGCHLLPFEKGSSFIGTVK